MQLKIEILKFLFGSAMETYITDGQAGRLLDEYAMPYLKNNEFSKGLIELQNATISHITDKVENGKISLSTETKSIFNLSLFLVFIKWLGILIVIAIIIILILKTYLYIKKLEEEVETLVEKLEDTKSQVNRRIAQETYSYKEKVRNLESKNSSLERENNDYKLVEEDFNRANILHPNLINEIAKMKEEEKIQKDKSIASGVNEIVSSVIGLSASYLIYDKVKNAYEKYSNLSNTQKEYINFDSNHLANLYKESKKLYEKHQEEERVKKLTLLASAAVTSVIAIIGNISRGTASNFRRIKEAKEIYDYLDSNVQDYFDSSVKERLDVLYSEAKRAKDEEDEEEEERRRQRMSSSSFSHSSFSGSHFGHGGHTSGGGASRHF